MNHEFMEALDELEKDRGIDKEILIDTIEQALLTAYKKNFGSAQNVRVEIDREREKVEYSLKKEAIDLALELSKKVIEKNIDEEKNKKLIDEFISEVGN